MGKSKHRRRSHKAQDQIDEARDRIPEEVHRRASQLSRALMGSKPVPRSKRDP